MGAPFLARSLREKWIALLRSCRGLIDNAAGLGDESLDAFRFRNHCGHSAFESFFRHNLGSIHAVEDDRRKLMNALQLPRRFEAVESRHIEIEHNQRRFQLAHLLDGFLTVGSFAADLESTCRRKEPAKGKAHLGAVVDDEHSIGQTVSVADD
jgi:hypothetical protein